MMADYFDVPGVIAHMAWRKTPPVTAQDLVVAERMLRYRMSEMHPDEPFTIVREDSVSGECEGLLAVRLDG